MSGGRCKPGSRPGTLLQGLLVLWLLAALPAPAWSQAAAPLPPPLAPGSPAPAWTVAPTSPKVLYAPNLPADVFRLKHKYFYYSGGYWYRSKNLMGPWRPVRKLPKALLMVDRSCFKSPPPW
jgi:hypothetical protein